MSDLLVAQDEITQEETPPWLIAFQATLSLPADIPPEIRAVASVVTAWHMHKNSLGEGDYVGLRGDVVRSSIMLILPF